MNKERISLMNNSYILKAISLLAALCIAVGCSGNPATKTTAEITISVISEIAEPEVDYVDEFDYTYYKNPTIWTTDKIFEELTINGQKFEAPLTLEKLGEGYSHSTDGGFYDSNKRIACLRLMYNDKSLAWVYFDDCDSIDDIEEKAYSSIQFDVNTTDEEFVGKTGICGINIASTEADLINNIGIPAVSNGSYFHFICSDEKPNGHSDIENEIMKFYVSQESDEVLIILINV